MRMTVPLIFAAALAASTPAFAQDTNNAASADVNATAPAATDANAAAPVATDANAVAPAAEPVATDTTTQETTTTEKKSGGFPWGVIGLLGLIGLIPRKGR